MTLGQQIKQIRSSKDLSQPVLADLIGIEQSYLSKLENDKSLPSNDILRKILVGLEINLGQLLQGLNRTYIHSQLRQIPDIDGWLTREESQSIGLSRRLLLLSSGLIVLAVTLFYVGFSQLIFATTQYEYTSEGVINEGEPFDYYEGGMFASALSDQHRHIREERAKRYAPDTIKMYQNVGSDFSMNVKGGTRRYVYSRQTEVSRPINAWLQVAGVFLFCAGAMGFVLEWRFSQLQKT